MRILVLPDNLYEYLQHVVRAHSVAGIEPEEGLAIYQLNQHVTAAQSVDVSNLGKAKLENLGPEGVALRFEPNPPAEPDRSPCGPGCTDAGCDPKEHGGKPAYPPEP